MFAFARSLQLRETLGNEGLVELDAALDEVGQHWKEDVLEIAADRFERRLGVELSQFRVEMARELATVRVEISASRLSTIRWVAGLLIAHAGVIIGSAFALMTFLANALKAN
jgi:hypothetical protein